jgi:hypothetical protein
LSVSETHQLRSTCWLAGRMLTFWLIIDAECTQARSDA